LVYPHPSKVPYKPPATALSAPNRPPRCLRTAEIVPPRDRNPPKSPSAPRAFYKSPAGVWGPRRGRASRCRPYRSWDVSRFLRPNNQKPLRRASGRVAESRSGHGAQALRPSGPQALASRTGRRERVGVTSVSVLPAMPEGGRPGPDPSGVEIIPQSSRWIEPLRDGAMGRWGDGISVVNRTVPASRRAPGAGSSPAPRPPDSMGGGSPDGTGCRSVAATPPAR